jgi:hypothetical protein
VKHSFKFPGLGEIQHFDVNSANFLAGIVGSSIDIPHKGSSAPPLSVSLPGSSFILAISVASRGNI